MADPNVESCASATFTSFTEVANPYGVKLPGILHAILQNNLEILILVYDNSKYSINMEWQDAVGNSILSYAAGFVSGYSHCSMEVINYVLDKIHSPTLKRLLRLENAQGNRKGKDQFALIGLIFIFNLGVPLIVDAYRRQDKTLYNALIAKDYSAAEYAISNYRAQSFPVIVSLPMKVDPISLVEVENDAQIERKNLQRLKDIENAQDEHGMENKNDERLKVDPYAKMSKIGFIVMDEADQPYDTMLLKVELNRWGGTTDTS